MTFSSTSRLLAGDAGLEPAVHHQPLIVAPCCNAAVGRQVGHDLRRNGKRHPEFGYDSAVDSVETGGRNSHDGVVPAIQSYIVIEDIWVAGKSAPPQTIAQHHHVVTATCLVIVRTNSASKCHRHSETGEEVSGDRLAPHPLRLSLAANARRDQRKVPRDSSVEQVTGLIAVVKVVGIGIGLAFGEHHHASRIFHWQQAPQQPIGHAEDRGIGRKAQRDRNDDDSEKPGARSRVRIA